MLYSKIANTPHLKSFFLCYLLPNPLFLLLHRIHLEKLPPGEGERKSCLYPHPPPPKNRGSVFPHVETRFHSISKRTPCLEWCVAHKLKTQKLCFFRFCLGGLYIGT